MAPRETIIWFCEVMVGLTWVIQLVLGCCFEMTYLFGIVSV